MVDKVRLGNTRTAWSKEKERSLSWPVVRVGSSSRSSYDHEGAIATENPILNLNNLNKQVVLIIEPDEPQTKIVDTSSDL